MNVAALILAAGRSARMGGANKLVARIGGKPMVRVVAEAALASRAEPVTVVTGHQAAEVESALAGLGVTCVRNPDYASGLSTSLAVGIDALPDGVDAVVVLLADMPAIDAAIIDRLVAWLDPAHGARIVVPTHAGRRGNPVVWAVPFFADLKAVAGDTGGRGLIEANRHAAVEVEIGPAVVSDVDTPGALAAAGGSLPGFDPAG